MATMKSTKAPTTKTTSTKVVTTPSPKPARKILHRRQKSCEELEYDAKASELAQRLDEKDKILKVVISPENQRSVHDYVSGLLDGQDVPTPEPPVIVGDNDGKGIDDKDDLKENGDKKTSRN